MRENLYTRTQLQMIMTVWGCTEPVPAKGAQVLVCWPKPAMAGMDEMARITWSEHTSDAGKRLYRVVMGSAQEILGIEAPVRAERNFDLVPARRAA